MWCKHCRQDVPALPSANQQCLCCPRCGEAICANPHTASGETVTADTVNDDPAAAASGAADEPPWYDNWEMDEQLRYIERVLRPAQGQGRESAAIGRGEATRFDLPHAGQPDWHAPEASSAGKRRKAASDAAGSAWGVFTWLVLALGTTSSVCGGILLAWSLAADRQELWTIGLPVALTGQIALLVGLVLQIDRLWRHNRQSAAKLDSVDEQLHQLKATTTLLGVAQGPTSSVFYSHFANGAGPQLLLADLKSQIDLLATKISQEHLP